MTDDDGVRCPRCLGTGVWQPGATVARRMAWRFTVITIIVFSVGYLLGMAVMAAIGWA